LVFCLDFSQLNITMSAGRLTTSHRSVYLHAMDLALCTGLTTCLENLEMSGNFDSCQGNDRDFTNSHGSVREKSCQGKVA